MTYYAISVNVDGTTKALIKTTDRQLIELFYVLCGNHLGKLYPNHDVVFEATNSPSEISRLELHEDAMKLRDRLLLADYDFSTAPVTIETDYRVIG